MSQLPDEIYVPKQSKHGTLDYVTAFIYPWAVEEDGYYKMADMQVYIPAYRLHNFMELVAHMREMQKKYGGEVDVCKNYEQYLDQMYVLENQVDELIKEWKEENGNNSSA